MTPDPTATYEYEGQQTEHRGKLFRYTASMWIQDMVPVHAFESEDKTIVTLKTDRWQDVMKPLPTFTEATTLEPSPNPPPDPPESGD